MVVLVVLLLPNPGTIVGDGEMYVLFLFLISNMSLQMCFSLSTGVTIFLSYSHANFLSAIERSVTAMFAISGGKPVRFESCLSLQ